MSQLDLEPTPGLGQCWGCGRLKESVPFYSLQPLLLPSGPRALPGPSWGSLHLLLGMAIVGWHLKL